MAKAPYRYRKCLRCRTTAAASQFAVLRFGTGHYHKRGGSLRKCPNCGKIGFTQNFPVTHSGSRV